LSLTDSNQQQLLPAVTRGVTAFGLVAMSISNSRLLLFFTETGQRQWVAVARTVINGRCRHTAAGGSSH